LKELIPTEIFSDTNIFFRDIAPNHFFLLLQDFFLDNFFYLFSCGKKKYLVSRKKILRQEKNVMSVCQEKILGVFLSKEIKYPSLQSTEYSEVTEFV